jgi:hypothetical protein
VLVINSRTSVTPGSDFGTLPPPPPPPPPVPPSNDGLTIRTVLSLIFSDVAVIIVLPTLWLVASPTSLMVTIVWLELVHLIILLISLVVLSVNVPVAENY